MRTVREVVAAGAGVALRPFGFEVRDRVLSEKPEGFPGYLAAAQRLGMDVNDYEESHLGWYPAPALLEATTFPCLQSDSIVCEVGPGTGRFSRWILPRIAGGQLHLVDHSPWIVRFLESYFREQPRVHVHLGDGQSLPFERQRWIDLVFVAGTVVALKLGTIQLYALEFARVCKPGGTLVFDYIDPTTAEGWAHLQTEGHRLPDVYTYHAPQVIDRVFADAGFEAFERRQFGKSTYFSARRAPR
ncbi:MAG: class I SAM-dependent methyltransferase [Chloroflexi bacterium]|nr:MAG: class I SAM-dependent methyltransferase [Chloroflexota bacterium]